MSSNGSVLVARGGGSKVIARGIASPWKAVNEARRVATTPLARAYFAAHGVRWGRGWRVYGLPLIQRHLQSSILIGDDLDLRSWFSSNPLGGSRCGLTTWTAGAVLEIREGVKATGVTICAWERITIGAHTRLGAGTMIIDSDFHPLTAAERADDPRAGRASPVTIGEGVFIGARSIVLKGSTIGAGAVVGAGSVVAGDVPEGALVAGNPARVVREL